MPIKFSCPYCKKSLAVKDELAGKQGKCPGCKQVVIIPQQHNTPPPGELLARPGKLVTKPPSKSGFDLEAMAAAALSEEKPAPVQETVTVDFTCPWCDTEIHIPAEFAGKQAPCTNPECKRIVKVPLLKKAGPRDWRKPDENIMPSGAKRDEAPIEGAWDSQAVGGVSRQALVQAAVIKEKRAPITIRGWILLGLGGTASLALVIAAVVLFLGYRQSDIEERGLQLAQSALSTDTLTHEDHAELETGLAEYYHRTGKRDTNDRSLGQVHLQLARQAAEQIAKDSPELPFVLRNLLPVQLKAVLETTDQLARIPGESQAKTRLETELADMQNDLDHILGMVPAGYVRESVIRALARSLLAGGGNPEEQAARLQGLIQRAVKPVEIVRSTPAARTTAQPGLTADAPQAPDFDHTDQLNALGVLGQELHQAGQQPLALRVANEARGRHKSEHGTPSQLVALLLLLNQQELDGIKENELGQAGRVSGLLRADKTADANRILEEQLKTSTTPVKAALLLDAADIYLRKQQTEPARKCLQDAAAVLENYPGQLLWERCRLVELSAEANGVDEAQKHADALVGGKDRNHGQEALLRARMQKNPSQPLDADSLLEGLNPDAKGYGAVVRLLARHNGRLDPGGTVTWAGELPNENARPFAGVGAVLGMTDGSR